MDKYKQMITKQILVIFFLLITLLHGCTNERNQDLVKSLENNLTQCEQTNSELNSEIQRYTTEGFE